MPAGFGKEKIFKSIMANTEPLTRSGKGHPCPVCNRTKDADCAFNDTIVCCHNNVGHQPGKYEQNGWVYRKDSSDGRCGGGQTWRRIEHLGAIAKTDQAG